MLKILTNIEYIKSMNVFRLSRINESKKIVKFSILLKLKLCFALKILFHIQAVRLKT